MRKVTNLGLNSFSGCKKLTKITAPVRFFKDEYIQEVSRDVDKGLKNNALLGLKYTEDKEISDLHNVIVLDINTSKKQDKMCFIEIPQNKSISKEVNY